MHAGRDVLTNVAICGCVGAEFANVNLGLDEPGFVYYLLQRASHASVGEPIDPAVIKVRSASVA